MTADAAAPKSPKVSLAWYEHLWTALPLSLVLIGGAVGGACGGAAWAVNNAIFQKMQQPILRYIVTGLVTAAAFGGYVILASALMLLFNRNG